MAAPATATPPVELHADLLEEDDEFEEFEDEGWMDRKEEEEEKHYWADDWDNDDINEEFAAQLRQELAATAK